MGNVAGVEEEVKKRGKGWWLGLGSGMVQESKKSRCGMLAGMV